MNGRRAVGCAQFDAHADELALGQVDEPIRSQLLEHAAECPRCRALLEGLGSVADRLLLAAPELEPSAGFESRVLDRLDASPTAVGPRLRRRRWLVAAALAGLLVIAAGAFVVLVPDNEPTSVQAAIVTSAGSEVGSVSLIAEPVAHVLVTIDAPRPGPGVRFCELLMLDGTWEQVGWWDAADVASGVWAVGIPARLLDATSMRITSDGDVVATATFD